MKQITKQWSWLVSLIFLAASTLFAQESETTSKKDPLRFNLGVVPDLDGNIALGTGFDFNYFAGLNAGAKYSNVTRSLATNKGGKKELAIIEEQIIKFNGLAYQFYISESDSFTWWVNPKLNGQSLFQKTQLNETNRNTDTFQTEDSNLQSYQFNAELESMMQFGSVRITLFGSFTPISSDKESATGYDTSLIGAEDEDGNFEYFGPTGDYSYSSSTETTYIDAGIGFDFINLIGSSDLYLGAKFSQLSYDFSFRRAIVNNGEIVERKVSRSIDRQDITGTLGFELAFLDLGVATPLATFNVTRSVYQDFEGNDIEDIIYGFGMTFKN